MKHFDKTYQGMNQNSSCSGKHYLCSLLEFFHYLKRGNLVATIVNVVYVGKATLKKELSQHKKVLLWIREL